MNRNTALPKASRVDAGDPFRASISAALPLLLTHLGSPVGSDRTVRSRSRLALAGQVVRDGSVPYRHQSARAELVSAAGVWDATFALPSHQFTTVLVELDGSEQRLPAWSNDRGLVVDVAISQRGVPVLTPAVRRLAEAALAAGRKTGGGAAVRVLPLATPRQAQVLDTNGFWTSHDAWLLAQAPIPAAPATAVVELALVEVAS